MLARMIEPENGRSIIRANCHVERPFAWIPHCRRRDNDDETLPESREAMISLALTRLMIRRLAKT
jgi:putative transposase